MRESIFKFKQFSIQNSASAMKVGTDGVLLGAWCSISDVKGRILDVGSGTGLISLMAAQRCNAHITAIEIDNVATKEGRANVLNSAWHDRIEVINIDFNNYVNCSSLKFDHIVSNPPFFENGLHSPNKERTLARHISLLTYNNLLSGSIKLLTADGKISIITPFEAKNKIEDIAILLGLSISAITIVYPTQQSLPKRILWELTKIPTEIVSTNLVIEEARHKYTQEYIELTKAFYLKM